MKKREKFVILILFLLILREFYGLAIKKEILLMYKNEKNIIIDEKDIDTTTVQVGNTVYITNIANNKEQKYTIVGTAEANVLQGKISNESPIAKSLLRRKGGRSNTSRSTSRYS